MSSWHVRGLVLPESVERDVFIVDGRIQVEPVDGATTIATDLFLLPGLVDVHAHLALASPAGDSATPHERVRASARAHLDAGVLAVREPGSVDHASSGLGPDEGLPRVTTAGRFLAPRGRYFPGLAKEVDDLDLPEAAVRELAHSGDWVKLIGDSPLPGPGLSRTFGEEAVVETVRRVHEAGGRVAMHCGLPDVIQTAIEAGVDSLEHATFLQQDQVPAMVAAGTAWVPTLSIVGAIRSMLPPADAAALARLPEVVAAAADAGVRIFAGTDAGMGPHGLVRHEISLLTEYGLSPEAAIGAASWAARALLRLPVIEPGAPGDLVGYLADPRQDLSTLATPQLLVLDGRVLRS